MPLTYERTFRVRHYECDAYGHVNNSNYLRYMQEAAFDASAAAGYDLRRYDEMNRLWLVRENTIDYLAPLRYGDTITVRTWVEDFRRSRSRRAYELTRDGGGEAIARGSTDWVFLDQESLRPARIPAEMMAAFFPEGAPDEAPRRSKFPEPPPPPPGVFRQRRRVEWRDIDMAGHVNNAVYLAYADDCGMQISVAYGWPEERMRAEGFGVVARQHRIEYKQPALLDDELEISTYVYNVRKATVTRYYRITRPADGALIAQVQTRYVWVNIETGRPIRVPEAFMDEFGPNIADKAE